MDLMLFERYKEAVEGPAKARLLNAIVTRELQLVWSCVRSLRRPNQGDVEDLVQHGAMGLVRAIQQWDPALGSWTPYAWRKVMRAIQVARPEQELIHIPEKHGSRNVLTREQVRTVRAIRALQGREATAEEVGVDSEIFAEWLAPPVTCRSDGGNKADLYAVEAGSGDVKQDMLRALHVLDPRAQRIVMALHVEGKTLREVGEEEKLSYERIRDIGDDSLEKMRARLTKM